MRKAPNVRIEEGRLHGTEHVHELIDGTFSFQRGENKLNVVASTGGGWDHVSVHGFHKTTRKTYTPSWDEMEWIRGKFFRDDEWVVQYSPARDRRVNVHTNVLHLWRPQECEIPTPPPEMV